jgi:hypothetical protein
MSPTHARTSNGDNPRAAARRGRRAVCAGPAVPPGEAPRDQAATDGQRTRVRAGSGPGRIRAGPSPAATAPPRDCACGRPRPSLYPRWRRNGGGCGVHAPGGSPLRGDGGHPRSAATAGTSSAPSGSLGVPEVLPLPRVLREAPDVRPVVHRRGADPEERGVAPALGRARVLHGDGLVGGGAHEAGSGRPESAQIAVATRTRARERALGFMSPLPDSACGDFEWWGEISSAMTPQRRQDAGPGDPEAVGARTCAGGVRAAPAARTAPLWARAVGPGGGPRALANGE